MPIKVEAMKPLQVQAKSRVPGFHAVGGVSGLHLLVRPGSSSWILRTMIGGQRRDFGLGGYPDVGIAAARVAAQATKDKIKAGIDPLAERRANKAELAAKVAVPTFEVAAKKVIAAKKAEWKSPKHSKQWASTLKAHAYDVIGKLPVDRIEVAHVLAVLDPIWQTKTETATRLRQRIESVLDWATVSKYRSGDNPARWKANLDVLLPKPGKIQKVVGHKAVPVADMPTFMVKLRGAKGTAAKAVEFAVLTAARSGEVRGATWAEVDLDKAMWTVPASRMKAGVIHHVPLSTAAVKLLEALPHREGLLFPSPTGKEFWDEALLKVLTRLKVSATVHGFRSSFRDWCGEETNTPKDVVERALAHSNPDQVDAAYFRSPLYQRRVQLMEDWSGYIDGTIQPGALLAPHGISDKSNTATPDPSASASHGISNKGDKGDKGNVVQLRRPA